MTTTTVDRGVLDMLASEIGDRDVVRAVVGTFVSELTDRLAAIEGAVASGDTGRTVTAAHTLKGASVTVGAVAMAGTAKTLELLARGGTLDGAHTLVADLRSQVPGVVAALSAW